LVRFSKPSLVLNPDLDKSFVDPGKKMKFDVSWIFDKVSHPRSLFFPLPWRLPAPPSVGTGAGRQGIGKGNGLQKKLKGESK